MIKEIKYNGYTATPDDYQCPDGELAAAVNLIPKDGAIKAVNLPEPIGSLNNDEELIFVHVVNSGDKNLILKVGNSLYYRRLGTNTRVLINTYSTNTFKCTATGNVLCVYNVGTMEHFVFLRGVYRTFSTEDYAVTILFGLNNATERGKGGYVEGILMDANGTQQATWENVVTNDYHHTGTNGIVTVNCSLTAGKTYRIRVTTVQTSTLYISMDVYYSDDTWENHHCGERGLYYQFTPPKNVTKFTVAWWSSDAYDHLANITFDGTITVDEQVTVYQGSGSYLYYNHTSVNTAVAALANGLLADSKTANRFMLPFFVRYGFRMIGGDIVTVSPPILIEPNTGTTPWVEVTNIVKDSGSNPLYNATATAKAYDASLAYKVKDLAKLRSLLEVDDLVDSLVIAVSEPVYMYKEGATAAEFGNETTLLTTAPQNKCYAIDGVHTVSSSAPYFLSLPHYTNTYESRLLSASTFKIIKEIPKAEISQSENFVNVPLDTGVLSGLSGITSLLPDNTENLSSYDAVYALSYNQREHWIGVIDCQFGGFDLDAMCGYVGTNEHYANYRVGCQQTENEALQYLVNGKRTVSSSNRRWFYYSNIKAKEAARYENYYIYNMTLTQHPYLKGAYYFGAASGQSDNNQLINTPRALITETKQNMMYISQQGNPIMIEQRLRVGDGCLYAGVSNVRPITRNQFGQVPLYVFSSDGIWGIEISSTGTYSVRQPVSRDVLTNIDSITPIDGAVLFATDRGVMLIAGSETQCISGQINIETPFLLSTLGTAFTNYLSENAAAVASYAPVAFRTFLAGCRMIFDYINQSIILYNPSKAYAYIYSIEQKQWGLMTSNIQYSVNSYPEAWAVNSSRGIVNFSDATPNASAIKGLLITRPLKLDAPDILKTIDTVLQRGYFREGHVKSILYGSRDLFHWHLVYSSTDHRLRGFRGTPYKYFRIVLVTDLEKDESIYGCTVQFTPRLLDQPR